MDPLIRERGGGDGEAPWRWNGCLAVAGQLDRYLAAPLDATSAFWHPCATPHGLKPPPSVGDPSSGGMARSAIWLTARPASPLPPRRGL